MRPKYKMGQIVSTQNLRHSLAPLNKIVKITIRKDSIIYNIVDPNDPKDLGHFIYEEDIVPLDNKLKKINMYIILFIIIFLFIDHLMEK